MILREKVRALPSSPGVYLMKDSGGSIIYVGKAKNLKKRVQSYFYNLKNHSPKTKKLVNHLRDFDYILTDTEFEAFMLECSLIHELKPPYNRKMKNPKAYTYILISNSDVPDKIKVTEHPSQENNNLLFGPYASRSTTERAIQAIKDFYKINCSNPVKRKSPCLNYSLGLCIGTCIDGEATKHYDHIMNKIITLLNGSDFCVLDELKEKMAAAAENFDYEAAGRYRDTIELINLLVKREMVIEFTADNKKIAIIEYLSDHTFKFFLIQRNKILINEKYDLNLNGNDEIYKKLKNSVISLLKKLGLEDSKKLKREEIDEAMIIYNYLTGNSCNYVIIPDGLNGNEADASIDQVINKLLFEKTRKPLLYK